MTYACLDDYAVFRRIYERPILKSRAPDCTKEELEFGNARAAQVKRFSDPLITDTDLITLASFYFAILRSPKRGQHLIELSSPKT